METSSVESIEAFNEWAWENLEEALLPFSKNISITSVALRAIKFALFLPTACGASLLNFIERSFDPDPKGFKGIYADSRKWGQVQLPQKFGWLKNFLVGTATSEYQYSGKENCPQAQWARWEEGALPIAQQSGTACDLWTNPEKFVQLLKSLHMTTFRFSVEWSNIEPKKGKFNEEALNHYVHFCKRLAEEGIEPMVTLHHFTHPQWFENEGGFEKEENIHHFVNFSKKIYERLNPHVKYWCTVNEPTIVAFSGYILGDFPPNRTNIALSATILKNLLMAHCETYRALKEIREDREIGLVHQALKFVAQHRWNPIEVLTASYLTRMTHDVVMNFLETGKYHYKIPLFTNVFYEEREITQLNDFIGVNCYARPLIGMGFHKTILDSTHDSHEEMTGMPFREDPAAIYGALMEMHEKTGKPLFITETGIATEDETQFKRYMERAFYAISQAHEEGVDIRGGYIWSLMKNFEWNLAWGHNFGICDQEGNLREGIKPLLSQALSIP